MTMMISRRALLGSLALGGSATLLPRAAFAWTNAEALYPATYAFIKGFVDRRELAGAIAAIGKDQAPPDYLGAGKQAMDSQRAVAPDTIWRLYSMTKPVTGMAAMLLIEDGKMTLDQPIADNLVLVLGSDFQYTGANFFDNPNTPILKFDSEILLNARIGLRDADDKWEVTAWAKNLTNELNFTSKLELFGTIYSTYIPPRTYGVTARFRF